MYHQHEQYYRIRELREDNDWTQKKIAEYLNCSQQAYSSYELGQRDVPIQVLIKLSELYGTSVDFLLGLTKKKEPYR